MTDISVSTLNILFYCTEFVTAQPLIVLCISSLISSSELCINIYELRITSVPNFLFCISAVNVFPRFDKCVPHISVNVFPVKSNSFPVTDNFNQ